MDKKHKNSWEILRKFRKFSKNFLRKFRKILVLAYLSKNLTNHALIFCAFGRKTQIVVKFWENFEIFWYKFLRKMEILFFLFLFFIFFDNLLLKIELSEITPFFYNNFFGFGGGGISPLSPWLRPCFGVEIESDG